MFNFIAGADGKVVAHTGGRSRSGLIGLKESFKEVKFLVEVIEVCVDPRVGFIV